MPEADDVVLENPGNVEEVEKESHGAQQEELSA